MMGPPEEHVAPAHAMKYAGVRASKVEAYDAGKKAEEEAPARSRVDGNKELRIRADPTGAKPFVFDAVDMPEEGKKFAPALNADGWTVNKEMAPRAPQVRARRESSILGYLRMKSKTAAAKEKGAARLGRKRGAVGLRAKWGADAGEAGQGVVDLEGHALRRVEDGEEESLGAAPGDFVKWKGPYHFAWQTMAPSLGQSVKARHLQAALAATHDGADRVVGYNWREVREILEAADANAATATSSTKAADPSHTPLHAACWRGDAREAERALEDAEDEGAAVRATNRAGRTPLHLLCAGSRPYFSGASGRTALAKALVAAGADARAADGRGKTPLHEACAAGDDLLVKALLAAGADELAADDRGRLPVDLAGATQLAHSPSISRVVEDIVGPSRTRRMRVRLKASSVVAACIKEAVARNKPYKPFAYYLYREGRFPRANSARGFQKKHHDVYRAGGKREPGGHGRGRQSF